jgi:hypothetical protein
VAVVAAKIRNLYLKEKGQRQKYNSWPLRDRLKNVIAEKLDYH